MIDLGHIAEGELTADVDGELAGPKLSVDETLTSDAVSFTPPLTTPRKSSGARLGDVSPDGEDATDTSVKPLDEAHKEFATTPLSSTICDAPKPSEGFSPGLALSADGGGSWIATLQTAKCSAEWHVIVHSKCFTAQKKSMEALLSFSAQQGTNLYETSQILGVLASDMLLSRASHEEVSYVLLYIFTM